ncbi:capsule biosynthesis protein [Aliirhizobium terrae]|uniref:capsule biosynthesis protein n=1 Tax=Terrirhizobium terrae TaxID=2926709 RepID=UPI00257539CB|nr:capsule biosynthesis protein [Rhizobium sp. CC-CFT758]WJH39066.1 capsule biosynthesis protein [Rhizobium sp. CC-CFT758]
MTDQSEAGLSHSSSGRALDYNRDVAKKLSVTARKLRLATSNRSALFKSVGLRPRMIDRLFSAAFVLLTVLLLIAPNLIAIAYYGYFASDQYESETRLTVRSSTPAIGKDQLAKVTGLPTAKIVQDTLIVTNFIHSGEMVSALMENDILRRTYGRKTVDIWARLHTDAKAEELLKYWSHMVTTAVSAKSGIVTVTVKAFSAQEAQSILMKVVKASEQVVNNVNDRIWKDVIVTAQNNLEHAAARLTAAREQLQAARNKAGILDVGGSSSMVTGLLGVVQKDLLSLQQRYASQSVTVSTNAPQMRVLDREIKAKEQQVEQLKAELAGATENMDASPNLANIALGMSQLELEQSLAEKQFASSVKSLEQVQFISKQQLIYLDTFLKPTLADAAEYPRRIFWIACTFVASLIIWGFAVGLLSVGRSRIH